MPSDDGDELDHGVRRCDGERGVLQRRALMVLYVVREPTAALAAFRASSLREPRSSAARYASQPSLRVRLTWLGVVGRRMACGIVNRIGEGDEHLSTEVSDSLELVLGLHSLRPSTMRRRPNECP
jgi:hypothetical protein